MDGNFLQKQANVWLAEKLKHFGCASVDQLTAEKCKAPLKDDIAAWLHGALLFMSRQSVVIDDLKSVVTELRKDMIVSQRSVVKLQEQLIESKDEQLQAVQKTVQSSVQETVKEEFKTYSEVTAAHKERSLCEPVTPEVLRTVVKTVVEQEDRSRNVMLFGLPEDEGEQLSTKVTELFENLGEKPRFDSNRLGKRNTATGNRPVKVSFPNTVTVNQILSKARNLRNTEKYKTVFISPDLSREDRAKHRQLVLDVKKLTAENPDMRHFIRGGKIVSIAKT